MKRLQKTVAWLLAALLLLSAASLAAVAAKETAQTDVPMIFVAGFVSTDTVDQETGEALFPPTSKTIRKAVKDAVNPVLKSALKGEFRGLDYPLNQAVLSLLDGLRCDENGDPINPRTGTVYQWPTPEEVRAACDHGFQKPTTDAIYYSYDWRLDMKTLAEQLHDFIEYVLECTGAQKVDIIAYSMGTCVLSSYLNLYKGEYIDSLILYLGALNGSSACGDPFENSLGMDSESLMAALNGLLGTDLKAEIGKALLDILYQKGMMDPPVDLVEGLLDRVFDELYRQSMPYIFGRIPGFWAMIPVEYYDGVRNTFSAGVVSDVFYEKVDYYHNVQLNIPTIIRTAMDAGVKIVDVVKYGYPIAPIIRDRNHESDFVVDTTYSSIGATCAAYNETLPEGYVQQKHPEKNYISPDNKIDASTCAFPDQTWFIKNSTHLGTLSGGTDGEQPLLLWLLTRETQPSVWDDPAFPQYMTYLPDGTCAPLTAETNWSVLGNYKKEDGFLARLKRIFADWKQIFSLLVQSVKK